MRASFDDWVLVLAIFALGLAMLGTALSHDIVAPELAFSVLVFGSGVGLTVNRILARRRRSRRGLQRPEMSWTYRS